ncbi:MAG: DUF1343 domain-containing protein [Candidatus Sumerlaeota bacterium]|nr:DUF1343 domain-containing protein [Candidatus Sumerlaeota bacterium]
MNVFQLLSAFVIITVCTAVVAPPTAHCQQAGAQNVAAKKGASTKMTRHKAQTQFLMALGDEATSHLWGDTSVPKGRAASFFYDETPAELSPAEFKAKPEERKARLEAAASAANAISSASNQEWLRANAHAASAPVRLKNAKVKLGNEALVEDLRYTNLLRGKRIGLITNNTGIDSHFVSTIDKLTRIRGCKLTALFAPEHGIRGAQGAGEKVDTEIDPITSVPVYSLHGTDAKKRAQNKPRPSMLKDVDTLVYDIQDIGNRSYTYAGTMKLCMQAAAENGKEFVVLDRPTPMGGKLISGNVLDPDFVTLVGWAPVAYIYGMTPGEMARMLNDKGQMGLKLTVIPMKGWKRGMKWWDTGLPWIPTSTHMQTPEACWHIAITGMLGELNSVSEGVGYPLPFAYVGAPWIESQRLADELNSRKLPGLYFRPAYFKPYYGIFKDKQCGGVEIHLLDFDKVMPVEAGMHIIEALQKMYPEQKILLGGADAESTKTRARVSAFNKVMGGKSVRRALLEGKPAAEIIKSWAPEREKFAKEREKYLLYR